MTQLLLVMLLSNPATDYLSSHFFHVAWYFCRVSGSANYIYPPHMPLPFHILYNRCGCFPVIMLVEQTVSLIYLGKLSDLVESGCLSSVKCWVKKKKTLKNSRCPILTHSFEPGRHRQVNVSAHTHSQERIQKLQCFQHINVTLYVNFIT